MMKELQPKEIEMKEAAEKFLADMDAVYWYGDKGRIRCRNYCLECSIPINPRYGVGYFTPVEKISELLSVHHINLADFLNAWVKVTGLGIVGSRGSDPLIYWEDGHMPSNCPSRSTIVKVLELL